MATISKFGLLTSYINTEPAGWRQLVQLENLPEYVGYNGLIVGEKVLAGLLPGLSAPVAVLPTRVILGRELNGATRDDSTATGTWFEDVHTLPKVISLGLVVSTQNIAIEVFNAYRRTPQSWDSFVNNAGVGVDLDGDPSLPEVYPPLTGSGLTMTVVVSTNGPAIVDSDMLFVWGVGTNIVLIDFQRVIPLATARAGLLIPEDEHNEYLEFMTNILKKATGREQRISIRKNPRQILEHRYKIDDGLVRAELDMLLSDIHHRLVGAPIWYEEVALTSDASSGDTVLNVESTDYSDFRVDSSIAVYVDGGSYDVRSIVSITPTTIEISSPLVNSYPAGSGVVPMRAAKLESSLSGSRRHVNLSELELRFTVSDNDIDIADTSPFSSVYSKVLLDDYNFMSNSIDGTIERDIVVIDSGTGIVFTDSAQSVSSMVTAKTFIVRARQQLWAVRRLMHALRGMQVSWYLPTFREDLEVTQDAIFDENTLFVTNVGYTLRVGSLAPKDVIRITMNNGDEYIRRITSSVVVSDSEEELTLDGTWPSTLDKDEILRVEFLQLVRFDSDSIHFQYLRGSQTVRISAPVRTVQQ